MLKKFKGIKKNKNNFDNWLLSIFLLINFLLISLMIWRHTWKSISTFVGDNYISIIVIVVFSITFFYFSSIQALKRKPSLQTIAIYILILSLVTFQLLGINPLLENLFHQPGFITSNTLFTFVTLIIFSFILGQFDFPSTDSWKTLYLGIRENFYKNISLFIIIFLMVSVIGFVNQNWIYVLSTLGMIKIMYLGKAVLSNLK
jgi:hypothetical protein